MSVKKKYVVFSAITFLAVAALYFFTFSTSSEVAPKASVEKIDSASSANGAFEVAGRADSPRDCTGRSPLGVVASNDCSPGIPSAEVLAQSNHATDEDIFREYKSPLARGVLLMWPGAAVEAFETRAKKCTGAALIKEDDEALLQECGELRRVNGFTILLLQHEANKGDAVAAFLFAKHSFKRAMYFEEKSQRDPFIVDFDKYAGIATKQPGNEVEINKLKKELEPLRQ